MEGELQLQGFSEQALQIRDEDLYNEDLFPPGTDEEYIRERLPSAQDVQAEILESTRGWTSLEAAFAATGNEDLLQSFEGAPMHAVSTLVPEQVPADLDARFKDRGDLKGHWKQFLKYTPEDATVSFLGDKAIVSYEGLGDSTEDIPNRYFLILNFGNSSKGRGIHIEQGFHQFGSEAVIDAHSNLPEGSQVFLKNYSLMMKLVRPLGYKGVVGTITPGDGTYDVAIHRFDKTDYMNDIYHESQHIKDFSPMTNPEESNRSDAGFTYSYIISNLSLPLGAILALTKVTPFALYGSIIFNAVTYAMSRSPENTVGNGFYSLVISELKAYAKMRMFSQIMERNGRNVKEPLMSDDFAPLFYSSYEPAMWAVIDSVRYAWGKRKKEESPQPQTAPALT